MNNILSSQLREKAGSDSYNRYEYQAHWIVYHMLDNFKNQKDFLVFCEFHDDMAESAYNSATPCMEFYQVKTSDTKKTWTLNSLFKKTRRPSGDYKNSFLGFIFYNFHKFSNECSKCHFVSNINFDDDVLNWQSHVRDAKILKKENITLYKKIKDYVRNEYLSINQTEFDEIFDRFIQNTFFTKTQLTLEGHVEQVKGAFFEVLSEFNLDTKSGYLLLTTIVESVRKKTTTIISTPISFEELKNKKGISSDIFKKLDETFRSIPKYTETYGTIKNYLKKNNLHEIQIKAILRKLNKHHKKILDVSDSLYQDTIRNFIVDTEKIIENNFDALSIFLNLNSLMEQLITNYQQPQRHHEIDHTLLRGVFYETILSAEDNDL